MSQDCPCGSAVAYADCCGALHRGDRTASTAEQLMRSRFSAFAVGEHDYLRATWHPRTRPTILDPEPAIEWRRLTIRATTGGSEQDVTGTVEYVAHYWDANERAYGRQQENSEFVKDGGQWFYLDGDERDGDR